jgi:antirestriction protein
MDTARIYVGTYAKYNSGSIAGKWLDLDDYADRDDFLAACKELHKDETDPELMFQDFEGFPRALYNEGYVVPAIWEWLALDEGDRELLAVYQDGVDGDGDIDAAREAYAGTFNSEAHWAEQFLEDTCGLEGVPQHLRGYIDFAAYGRDMRLGGDMVFVRHKGDLWAFDPHR